MDPTVGMLARLLAAAGEHLELGLSRSEAPKLTTLIDAWRHGPNNEDRVDWTRLRAFLDYLARHPDHAVDAVAERPERSGSALLDNLLAGMAEKVCDDANVPRPAWTAGVQPLEREWVAPGTPRMQQAARAATPPQLADRKVIVSEDSLWRLPETVHA